MDVLIKGMEMPRGNNVLVVDSAGTITKVNRWTGKVEATDPFLVKAIELPEHGALKDTDFIISCLDEIKDTYPRTYEIVKGILDRTPTVLGAST